MQGDALNVRSQNVSLAREDQVSLSLRSMHEPYSKEHCHPFARFWREGICFSPRTNQKADPQAAPVFPILEQPAGGLGMTVSKD